MRIKLLAVDLDDTLLNGNVALTPRGISAVKRAAQAGVMVVVASGRMIRSVRPFARELGVLNVYPMITFAGALVTGKDGEELYSSPLPSESAARLVNYCRERSLHLQVYTNEDFIFDRDGPYPRSYAQRQGFAGVCDPGYLSNPGLKTPKALIIEEPDRIEALKADLINEFSEFIIARSREMYLDITNPAANKGAALCSLMDRFGLEPGEVMAIGDNEIDVSMIKAAGLGVAVANALECAKEAADYVTLSNEEDGAALAIEKFILEEP